MTSSGRTGTFGTWLCVALLASCLVTDVVAGRKLTGSSSKTKSRPSSSTASRQQTQQQRKQPDSSHADAARLSYSGYNSQPNPPRNAQHLPSAPAAQPAAQPGWNVPPAQRQNVPHSQSAAPYPNAPYAQGTPAHNAPYPSQQQQNHGVAPPPYSPYGQQPGVSSHGVAPPAYSPAGSHPYSGQYCGSDCLLLLN